MGTFGYGPAQGIGARRWMKRAIMSMLAPLTGARASGSATVAATGSDVVLPNASYAYPVIESAVGSKQLDRMRLLKTSGDATVTAAGVSVPIVAALGGAYMNLAVGTKIAWRPAVPGVEAVSVLDAALTGGTDPTAEGTLRRIVTLDQLGLDRGRFMTDAWRTTIGAFPAAVLAWTGGARGERVGRSARLRALKFRLFVLTSTAAGMDDRNDEGETILDYIEGLLENRSAVDDEIVSNPSVGVVGSGVLTSDDGSYVYYVDVEAMTTIERIELRTFNDWLQAQTVVQTDTDTEYPDPDDALTTVDMTLAMASP